MMRTSTALNSISILLVVVSLAGLVLNGIYGQHGLTSICAFLLASSAVTAMFALMSSTMFLFHVECYENTSIKALAMIWMPVALVDLSFVELLAGGFVWYAAQYHATGYLVLGGLQLAIFMASLIKLAVRMWRTTDPGRRKPK